MIDKIYRFGVQVRRLWTPKVVSEAMETARRHANEIDVNPLILVPYLGEEKLQMLEAQGVSGLDLCGNGVIIVREELLVLRTGIPNQLRWQGGIKNVYRKNSSIAARAFLLVPQFNSVKQALEHIQRRGGEVATATVSKVCKQLEADLVIERCRGEEPKARRLRLLQPEKLLDLLAENYTQPSIRQTFQGKYRCSPNELLDSIDQWRKKAAGKMIRTGADSVEAYAVMAREPVQPFYCSDLKSLLDSLGDDVRETDRFANVIFKETSDDFVYFDGRPGLLASPIQVYLEMVHGDKREKETAEQVRRFILEASAQASGEEPQNGPINGKPS